MRIESIELRNYRLFRAAELKKLSPLSVIVGANGAGKSTLFDALGFLNSPWNKVVGGLTPVEGVRI